MFIRSFIAFNAFAGFVCIRCHILYGSSKGIVCADGIVLEVVVVVEVLVDVDVEVLVDEVEVVVVEVEVEVVVVEVDAGGTGSAVFTSGFTGFSADVVVFPLGI